MAKAKLKWGLTLFVLLSCFLPLTRPLFYTVVGKVLTVGIKALLRRSIGPLVRLRDAILDEAVQSLETGLIAAPVQSMPQVPPVHPYDIQPFYLLDHLAHPQCLCFAGGTFRKQVA